MIWLQIILTDYTHREGSLNYEGNAFFPCNSCLGFGRQWNNIWKNYSFVFLKQFLESWNLCLESSQSQQPEWTLMTQPETLRIMYPAKCFMCLCKQKKNVSTHWVYFSPAQNYIIFNSLLDKIILKQNTEWRSSDRKSAVHPFKSWYQTNTHAHTCAHTHTRTHTAFQEGRALGWVLRRLWTDWDIVPDPSAPTPYPPIPTQTHTSPPWGTHNQQWS